MFMLTLATGALAAIAAAGGGGACRSSGGGDASTASAAIAATGGGGLPGVIARTGSAGVGLRSRANNRPGGVGAMI